MTKRELRALHKMHLTGASTTALAKRAGIKRASLLIGWARLGLRQIPFRKSRGHVVPDADIQAMHAAWLAGEPLQSIERRHGRPLKSLRFMFAARGLDVKPAAGPTKTRRADGTFSPDPEPSDADIAAAIASVPKFMIPGPLVIAWKHWDLAKRGAVIASLRARFADPRDQPQTPFSANVTPFDYATQAAQDIARAANAGKPAQQWPIHLKISSQGVIWNGRLFFWSRKTHCYQEGIRWTPENGRPVLSRAIWQASFGVAVPAGSVVRHKDGNPNNLAPANLYVCTRDELARANQAAALTRKARALTNAILAKHQTTNQHHAINRSLLAQISNR
jgi:hypothetical protein